MPPPTTTNWLSTTHWINQNKHLTKKHEWMQQNKNNPFTEACLAHTNRQSLPDNETSSQTALNALKSSEIRRSGDDCGHCWSETPPTSHTHTRSSSATDNDVCSGAPLLCARVWPYSDDGALAHSMLCHCHVARFNTDNVDRDSARSFSSKPPVFCLFEWDGTILQEVF